MQISSTALNPIIEMPQTSNRGHIMPESPIRKLVPLSDKAKERGIKVYHLNIGQPDVKTPTIAFEAMKKIDRSILEYSPSNGFKSLRKKLAHYYHGFNIDVDENDIIITTGGSEAVNFAFMSCLDPGDEIIVPEPAYANYTAFAIGAGAIVKPVVSTIEEGFALPPVEKFEELITPRTKGILICNPNNPTGYLYTQSEMNKIRDLVKKYDLYLFSDEVYRDWSPLYICLPLGGYRRECHPFRLRLQTLQRMRYPYRCLGDQERGGKEERNEVLSSQIESTAYRTNHSRGFHRHAKIVYA